MPGFDRTGPLGQGPGTGRGMGYCNLARPAGFGRPMGMGFRRGFGAGRGNRFCNRVILPQRITANDRIAELESQISDIQQEISALRQHDENRDNQR